MWTQSLSAAACIGLAAASLYAPQAAAQDQTKQRTQVQQEQQTRERIYGYQLMTPQERNDYRNRMRNARSEQEREQIRNENHTRMQERAKEKGVTLPDSPPPR